MSRLTKKTEELCYLANPRESHLLIRKLGQLEDIEEELGIDLITLSKASKCFYSKILDCYCPHPNPIYKSCGEKGEWYIDFMDTPHKLKDFGKTWALTKEELL